MQYHNTKNEIDGDYTRLTRFLFQPFPSDSVLRLFDVEGTNKDEEQRCCKTCFGQLHHHIHAQGMVAVAFCGALAHVDQHWLHAQQQAVCCDQPYLHHTIEPILAY